MIRTHIVAQGAERAIIRRDTHRRETQAGNAATIHAVFGSVSGSDQLMIRVVWEETEEKCRLSHIP